MKKQMKRIDEAYLARAGAIMSSLSGASIPVVAFLISELAVFVATKCLFVMVGVFDIIVCLLMLRTKVLNKE